MSIWCHVAGIIRVDGMNTEEESDIGLPSRKSLPLDLGTTTENAWKEKDYNKQEEIWKAAEKSGIPMGSEGSLTWQWIPTGYDGSMALGFYAIEGDLRDFESPEPIIKWLEHKIGELQAKHFWVRQLTIQIQVEGQDPIIITNDGKLDKELIIMKINKATKVLYGEKT